MISSSYNEYQFLALNELGETYSITQEKNIWISIIFIALQITWNILAVKVLPENMHKMQICKALNFVKTRLDFHGKSRIHITDT